MLSILEYNSITKGSQDTWKHEIESNFSEFSFLTASSYLSLYAYLNETPQKFYNHEAFNAYSVFLKELNRSNPELLALLLRENEQGINIANKVLSEINKRNIHDIFYSKNELALLNFLETEIHYSLLKILEGPFSQFIHLAAKVSRIKRGAKIDGLDLFNSVQELSKGPFAFITTLYDNIQRNGIAHGKIIYKNRSVDYVDKQGNRQSFSATEVIKRFDSLMDVVNGFSLALKIFYFTEHPFLIRYSIQIPQSILIEELQANANGPCWTILNCLDSYAPFKEQSQLTIYIKNEFWDYGKVLYNAFRTAALAEKFTIGYQRIFMSFHSTHSDYPDGCWAAFNGEKLKQLRENNEAGLEGYKDVLESNLLFFVPKYKFPKFLYTFGTFYMSFRTILPDAFRKAWDRISPKVFFIRETQAHTKKYFTVIVDTSVIIKPSVSGDAQSMVRKNYKKIISSVIRHTRTQQSLFSGVRYKPVKYIRVMIYDTDLRLRHLRSSGLIEQLICSIEVNTSKKIPTIDILGGTPEQLGKYRIVWNRAWLNRNKQP